MMRPKRPYTHLYTFSFFPCPPQPPLPLGWEHVHVTSIWPIKCTFLRPRIGTWSFKGAEMKRALCGSDCNNVQFPGPAGGQAVKLGLLCPGVSCKLWFLLLIDGNSVLICLIWRYDWLGFFMLPVSVHSLSISLIQYLFIKFLFCLNQPNWFLATKNTLAEAWYKGCTSTRRMLIN